MIEFLAWLIVALILLLCLIVAVYWILKPKKPSITESCHGMPKVGK